MLKIFRAFMLLIFVGTCKGTSLRVRLSKLSFAGFFVKFEDLVDYFDMGNEHATATVTFYAEAI